MRNLAVLQVEGDDVINCKVDKKVWCEDGSVRMDIKNLQDQYHQTTVSQINKLWSETDRLDDEIRELRDSLDVKVLQKQVKALQKQAHITTEVVTTIAEMIEVIERKI